MNMPMECATASGQQDGLLLSGQRVLIVEENYLIADRNRELVTGEGGSVLGPFASAYPAFHASMTIPPTVALLDLDLDGRPCFRLADALVSLGVPVVFLTGYEPDIAPSRHAGVAWITKPACVDEVLKALSAAIA